MTHPTSQGMSTDPSTRLMWATETWASPLKDAVWTSLVPLEALEVPLLARVDALGWDLRPGVEAFELCLVRSAHT